MAQNVYVLTSLMGEGKAAKEWRPLAVVTSEATAEQWTKESNNNDYIFLELDDLNLTSLVDPESATFKAKPTVPPPSAPAQETEAVKTIKNLMETNQRLLDTIEHMATRYKDKQILKLVQQMKGKTSKQTATSEYPKFQPGERVSHAWDDKQTGTVERQERQGRWKGSVLVKWDGHPGAAEHTAPPNLKRLQQTMFASTLLNRKL